jgi:hypothetical protein
MKSDILWEPISTKDRIAAVKSVKAAHERSLKHMLDSNERAGQMNFSELHIESTKEDIAFCDKRIKELQKEADEQEALYDALKPP